MTIIHAIGRVCTLGPQRERKCYALEGLCQDLILLELKRPLDDPVFQP